MNELLEDGFGLMVLGMGFVFLFLVILIFATRYMSRLLNHYFPETTAISSPAMKPAVLTAPAVDPQLSVVIAAAVHQHRQNKNS